MRILSAIRQNTTILMPICCVVGLTFPDVSNVILTILPSILFFLMFFTLLNIEQHLLFRQLLSASVWGFALLQSVIICITLAFTAYACGIRGDLLLAITAVGATAPLFGSGAIVNAMGFDAMSTMAKTIAATILMPFSILIVLYIFANDSAHLDVGEYMRRLVTYIALPILLAILIRKFSKKTKLNKYFPKIAQYNVFLVCFFPLGLMGGFRQTFNVDPLYALYLLVVAIIMSLFFFSITYIVIKKTTNNNQRSIIAAIVSTGRNVLLTYSIAFPFLGDVFFPLVGALQIPIYLLPYFAKRLLSKSDHQ